VLHIAFIKKGWGLYNSVKGNPIIVSSKEIMTNKEKAILEEDVTIKNRKRIFLRFLNH
jgi:hypothetical protein